MSTKSPTRLMEKNVVWVPTNEEEALCHLMGLTAPTVRAAEVAHGLLKKFGDATSVIRASFEELRTVRGVCNDIAYTLKSVHSIHLGLLWRQLQQSTLPGCIPLISNWCREHLCSEEADVFMAVCYSHRDFCGVTPYTVGMKGHVKIYAREIIKFALRQNATAIVVVLARKHGTSIMTEDEQIDVSKLREAANALGIEISEVIVITSF